MIKIIKAEGEGKTSELIELAKDCDGYIVCKDPLFVHRMATDLGFDINYPLTYHEFIGSHHLGKGIKYLLIDDVDMLMSTLCSVPIKAITLTHEELDMTNFQIECLESFINKHYPNKESMKLFTLGCEDLKESINIIVDSSDLKFERKYGKKYSPKEREIIVTWVGMRFDQDWHTPGGY